MKDKIRCMFTFSLVRSAVQTETIVEKDNDSQHDAKIETDTFSYLKSIETICRTNANTRLKLCCFDFRVKNEQISHFMFCCGIICLSALFFFENLSVHNKPCDKLHTFSVHEAKRWAKCVCISPLASIMICTLVKLCSFVTIFCFSIVLFLLIKYAFGIEKRFNEAYRALRYSRFMLCCRKTTIV